MKENELDQKHDCKGLVPENDSLEEALASAAIQNLLVSGSLARYISCHDGLFELLYFARNFFGTFSHGNYHYKVHYKKFFCDRII